MTTLMMHHYASWSSIAWSLRQSAEVHIFAALLSSLNALPKFVPKETCSVSYSKLHELCLAVLVQGLSSNFNVMWQVWLCNHMPVIDAINLWKLGYLLFACVFFNITTTIKTRYVIQIGRFLVRSHDVQPFWTFFLVVALWGLSITEGIVCLVCRLRHRLRWVLKIWVFGIYCNISDFKNKNLLVYMGVWSHVLVIRKL